METIVKNIRDLDESDRSALERVVGHELRETQQVIVNIVNLDSQSANGTEADSPPWAGIYEGLSDEEIDRIDSVIRQPVNLTRTIE